jgi:hypothetical protein
MGLIWFSKKIRRGIMKIVCECGAEVGIDNSDAVAIIVGKIESQSWIHACVCNGCSRVYWYKIGKPVFTARREAAFFVDGRLSTRNGNGKV